MSFTRRRSHYTCIRRKRWWRLPVCLSGCLRKEGVGEGLSISLRPFFFWLYCHQLDLNTVMEVVSPELSPLESQTDRKRVAAREDGQLEIGERETGDTTAGKEELMKESEIGRKTTCPHVVPRSTGSDTIVPRSAICSGFFLLRYVGLQADKDKARCREET